MKKEGGRVVKRREEGGRVVKRKGGGREVKKEGGRVVKRGREEGKWGLKFTYRGSYMYAGLRNCHMTVWYIADYIPVLICNTCMSLCNIHAIYIYVHVIVRSPWYGIVGGVATELINIVVMSQMVIVKSVYKCNAVYHYVLISFYCSYRFVSEAIFSN